jgi:hypothetical protein
MIYAEGFFLLSIALGCDIKEKNFTYLNTKTTLDKF